MSTTEGTTAKAAQDKADEKTFFEQLSESKQRNLVNFKIPIDIYNETLASVEIFLSALNIDAGKPLVWQIIGDNKKGDVNLKNLRFNYSVNNQPHATMHELAGAFLANGYRCGVYLTINETKGKTRKAADIKSIRAFFLDLDGSPVEPVLEWKYPPHMVIETSPGKYHCYWIIEDMPTGINIKLKKTFKEVQLLLASRFHGDKSVNDLPRVMRVPGFLHAKKEPFQSRLIYPTTIDEIQEKRYPLKYADFMSGLKDGLEENEWQAIIDNHGNATTALTIVTPNVITNAGYNLSNWDRKHSKNLKMAKLFKDKGLDYKDRAAGGYEIECAHGDDHASNDPYGAFVTDADGENGYNIHCMHDTCIKKFGNSHQRVHQLKKLIDDGKVTIEDIEKPEYGGGPVSNAPDQIYVPAPQIIDGEFPSLASKCWNTMPDGRDELMHEVPAPEKDDDGEIFGILPININLHYFLHRFGITVLKDDFSGKFLVRGVPGTNKYSELDDDAYRALHQTCNDFGLRFSIGSFIEKIKYAAGQNRFHPVRYYLDGLEWDGIERIDTWLSDFCSIEDNEYSRAVGALFLMGAVRRVREPGVKFDTMLVFEGAEGTGKSSLLKLLVGDRWFTDALQVGMKPQEVIEIASGSWICEIEELTGMSIKEVAHVKAFISKTEDVSRMAFGRVTQTAPRQFVLVGTTNDRRYLKSTTGNRRFLPLTVKGSIDLEGIGHIKDQLWAEASHREAQGASITLPKHLWKVAGVEQNKRLLTDPKADAIEDWLGDMEGVFVPTEEIYIHLGFTDATGDDINLRSVETRHKELVTQTMESMGWEQKQHNVGDGTRIRKRGWHKGEITKIYGKPPMSVKNVSTARGAQSRPKVLENA